MNLLEELSQIGPIQTDPIAIVINLAIALACGIVISFVYRLTYKGPSYSAQFVNSLILLSLITAVVIMVIGDSLATAFGLVGAMSIIRFRTAVRDVQDIVFIFFSLAIGLAAGVGLGALAIICTLFISLVMFLVIATNINAPKQREYMLQVTHSEDDEGLIEACIKNHCQSFKLMSYQSTPGLNTARSYYQIKLIDKAKHTSLVKDLESIEVTDNVNLFFDDIEPRI